MRIPRLVHTQYDEVFDLVPSFERYGNGRLALRLYGDEGPFATISVNVASDLIYTDIEMFVKNYSENEQIVTKMLHEGWLEATDRRVQSGHVQIPVMRLAGPLLDFYNSLSESEVLHND
jgi:hypothetical protein